MKTLDQWDSAVGIYDNNMGNTGDDFNRNIVGPSVLSLLGDYRGKTILDSGCASGYFSAMLAVKAKKVMGTDFSGKFINLCREKYKNIKNLEFIQHDVTEKMTLEESVFNIIISKMVLQYVVKLHEFARESMRILKEGGTLIVAVDHPFNTQFYFAQQLAGKPNHRYGVLNDYFDRKPHVKLSLWNKVKLTWYPKTVSDYLLPFVKAGFVLADIHESPEEKNGIKIPRVLTLKFTKLL